jgi:hypothetical protein
MIIWQGKGGVQDRTIYEDSVFARVCDSLLPSHVVCCFIPPSHVVSLDVT